MYISLVVSVESIPAPGSVIVYNMGLTNMDFSSVKLSGSSVTVNLCSGSICFFVR